MKRELIERLYYSELGASIIFLPVNDEETIKQISESEEKQNLLLEEYLNRLDSKFKGLKEFINKSFGNL